VPLWDLLQLNAERYHGLTPDSELEAGTAVLLPDFSSDEASEEDEKESGPKSKDVHISTSSSGSESDSDSRSNESNSELDSTSDHESDRKQKDETANTDQKNRVKSEVKREKGREKKHETKKRKNRTKLKPSYNTHYADVPDEAFTASMKDPKPERPPSQDRKKAKAAREAARDERIRMRALLASGKTEWERKKAATKQNMKLREEMAALQTSSKALEALEASEESEKTRAITDSQGPRSGMKRKFVLTDVFGKMSSMSTDPAEEAAKRKRLKTKPLEEWDVTDVLIWLGGKYANLIERFKKEQIDGSAMACLNPSDLDFLPIGTRIHLLKDIQDLKLVVLPKPNEVQSTLAKEAPVVTMSSKPSFSPAPLSKVSPGTASTTEVSHMDVVSTAQKRIENCLRRDPMNFANHDLRSMVANKTRFGELETVLSPQLIPANGFQSFSETYSTIKKLAKVMHEFSRRRISRLEQFSATAPDPYINGEIITWKPYEAEGKVKFLKQVARVLEGLGHWSALVSGPGPSYL